ncbi:hypothetical protein COT99_02460, partial [Candidatus Falkowbacteria bacterium CG10_big_fil_rev_8_21_14_0_10_43_10]
MAKKIKKGAGFILNKALISILLSISLIVGGIFIYQKAFAVNNITPATGGENISLDTVGGSYTTLGTISITEAALAEIKTGTHTFTLPPGWEFNTASTITFFSNWETSGLLVDGSFDITPSANFFSINVVWESWQAPATISFSNIKVRPTHTTPQSALKITHTAGVMTGVTNGNGNGVVGDNFGLLSSIVGQAASLRVTSSGASSVSTTVGVSKPLTITAYDKHGNIVSSGPNNYIGAKNLIFSGLSSSPAGGVPNVNGVNLGGATSITFTNGVASATVTPYKAESVSLDVLQSGTSVSSASDASYDLDISTVDNTKPVITLTGANPQTIEVGSAYSELGATASDNHDGNITASIVINATAVNTAVVGSYTITYNV